MREEKRFTTKGRPTVQLATFDGAIVIRGWDRDEISVEVEKRGRDKAAAEAIEVLADQKGDVVRVEARKKDMADGKSYQIGWNGVSRSAKLIVSVPTGSDLIVRTGDGSIRVDHVNGKVELRSADGSVTGRDLAGDVVAHTEDGAIRLEGVDGKCDVASDDGSIAVQGRLDGLRVSTEDGSVVVRAAAGFEDRPRLEPLDRRRLDGAVSRRRPRRRPRRRGARRLGQARLRAGVRARVGRPLARHGPRPPRRRRPAPRDAQRRRHDPPAPPPRRAAAPPPPPPPHPPAPPDLPVER